VKLAGWVHRRRDHGGVVFVDLRDRSGLMQVVVSPSEEGAYATAERLRSEFVVAVSGAVRLRPEGTSNPNLPTGEVEVAATDIEIVAESETPPFPIEDRVEAGDEVRLKYRYLDLRRAEMQRILRLRHRVNATTRNFLDSEDFTEVETPTFSKSTPEGARDYLIPSRLYPGTFYALLQSPQLFKQLLMISGIDRYFQIVRCFRDEDPRADRQPEFTQLDVEMSFAGQDDVIDLAERLMTRIVREAVGAQLATPFPRVTFAEAMSRFGADPPDLRFGLELTELTEAFAATNVRVFRTALDAGGAVIGLKLEGGGTLSRSDLDRLAEVARRFGAGGLAWVAFEEDGISSPLRAALAEDEIDGVRQRTGAVSGDLVLLVSDRRDVAQRSIGEVRLELADMRGLRPSPAADDPEAWKFVWVVDRPLVEWNEKERRWDPLHHPFTSPRPDEESLLDEDPGSVRAMAYDLGLNGWELGGGSIRIHRPDLQRKVLELIGVDGRQAEARFGWFLRAFDFGAPPHGGIAFGWDRLVALLAGKDNIREVIAFPKASSMADLLTGAPDEVGEDQLAELHIKIVR